jgi:hypothetical protein
MYVYADVAQPPQQIIDMTTWGFNNITKIKLYNSVFYVNGIEVGTVNQDLLDENIDISVDTTPPNSPPSEYMYLYGSGGSNLIVNGFTLNGEVFKLNEGAGGVLFGSNSTIGEFSSDGNVDDMWIDTKVSPKQSPFVFLDTEDFGVLPESFRLIFPSSIEGDDGYVRSISAIVDRYVIDTNKYDIVYS